LRGFDTFGIIYSIESLKNGRNIMDTWATRIKERMKDLGLTQEALAEKMGITRGAITHYLAGRRQPPLNQFQKLATILKADPAWLQFGKTTAKSEMLHSVTSKKEKMAKYPLSILSWEQAMESADIEKVRGEAKELVSHFYTDKSRWYALRVKGESMTAPSNSSKSYHEGSIIIVDPDKVAEHGMHIIAVLPHSNEAVFKQYIIDSGTRYLKPLNPQYPMISIDESTHICGVVIGCFNFYLT
jgi:SOS-response transcriptional repressor LexA